MSWETYDEKCEGCQPVAIDIQTGLPMPADDPRMQAMQAIFDRLSLAERQAWHRFTCQNSRTPEDLRIIDRFYSRVQAALRVMEKAETKGAEN